MNCHHARKELADYSAGLITGLQRDRLRDHVEGCPSCQQALEQFGQLDAQLRVERLPGDSALARQVMSRVRAEAGGLPRWVRIADNVGPLALLVAALPAIILILMRRAESWAGAAAAAVGDSAGITSQPVTAAAILAIMGIAAGVVWWATNRVGETLT